MIVWTGHRSIARGGGSGGTQAGREGGAGSTIDDVAYPTSTRLRSEVPPNGTLEIPKHIRYTDRGKALTKNAPRTHRAAAAGQAAPPRGPVQRMLARAAFLSLTLRASFPSAEAMSTAPPARALAAPDRTKVAHPAPGLEQDIGANPTVFGRILRGELPAAVYLETSSLLAFRDISPRARTHALVIPKRRVRDPSVLTGADLPLLDELVEAGKEVLRAAEPQAFEEGDYIFRFHWPPFNSVKHLHLHCLAPASTMSWWNKDFVFWPVTPWSVSEEWLRARLERRSAPR